MFEGPIEDYQENCEIFKPKALLYSALGEKRLRRTAFEVYFPFLQMLIPAFENVFPELFSRLFHGHELRLRGATYRIWYFFN